MSQDSQVERSIIWLIIVLLIYFHHLENENLFLFKASTSALGKPGFVDYKHGILYFQIAIANISQYAVASQFLTVLKVRKLT